MAARSKPREEPNLSYVFTLSPDSVRAAFQRRTLDALSRVTTRASTELLADALAASTDVGALAHLLGDSDALGSAVIELEPMAPLIARNAEHRLELLAAAGGVWSAAEVAAFLGVSRQAVDKRRQASKLLGLRQGGDWRYPRCQFDEASHEALPDLPKALAAFSRGGPWIALDFLLAPDQTLGGKSPIEVLRRSGWTEDLARLARIEGGDGFA